MSQALQQGEIGENVEAVRVIGTVKWFDPAKGYGFVVPSGASSSSFGGDVLLHITVLRQYGESVADEGANIVCDAVRSEKGWQAVNVLEMDAPRAVETSDPDSVEYRKVVVKWFNRTKGYGFVQEPHADDDIFVHAVVAREGGYESLEPGDEFEATVQTGSKGRYVGLIKPIG